MFNGVDEGVIVLVRYTFKCESCGDWYSQFLIMNKGPKVVWGKCMKCKSKVRGKKLD